MRAVEVGACLAAMMFSVTAGCVTDRFSGVDLKPGAASPELQALARIARAGDKRAQFALAERLEGGVGVRRDANAAARLYRAAATSSGGTRIIFVPRAGGGVSAVPVSTGTAVPGLAAAQVKLESLSAPTMREVGPSSVAERPGRKRVQAVGSLRALGPSDVCTTQRAAIQAASDFHIATCAGQRYRFEPRRGAAVEVIDLALTTDDDDAIRSLPIPFGMFDALELGADGPLSARGIVTYDVVGSDGNVVVILRSFSKERSR